MRNDLLYNPQISTELAAGKGGSRDDDIEVNHKAVCLKD